MVLRRTRTRVPCQWKLVTAILNPSDEFSFWAEKATTRGNDSEFAEKLTELFEPISKDFAQMEQRSFDEATELLELTQDTLDEVWRLEELDSQLYPEVRMRRLLEVIGKNATVSKTETVLVGHVTEVTDGLCVQEIRSVTLFSQSWMRLIFGKIQTVRISCERRQPCVNRGILRRGS